MSSLQVINEIALPVLGSVALWIVRRMAGSLKVIQELPQKLEETTERIEKKHEQRFGVIEEVQRQQGTYQKILTEQIAIALDKIAEGAPRR